MKSNAEQIAWSLIHKTRHGIYGDVSQYLLNKIFGSNIILYQFLTEEEQMDIAMSSTSLTEVISEIGDLILKEFSFDSAYIDILNIYKNRSIELVDVTLEVLSQALGEDEGNKAFKVHLNEDQEIVVLWVTFVGEQIFGPEFFYIVDKNTLPAPEAYGYDSYKEMDFEAEGFENEILSSIEDKIEKLTW